MTPPNPPNLDDITPDELVTIIQDLINEGYVSAEYIEPDDDVFLTPTGKPLPED